MKKRRLWGWLLLILLIAVIHVAVSTALWWIERGQLTVYAIDVGQGDATLIRSAGKTMLVDTGPGVAEEELCAVLSALGVRRIDVLVLTHPDEDHIGGADLVCRRFSVGKVYISPYTEESDPFLRLLEAVEDERCPLYPGTAGISFSLGRAEVTFLSPEEHTKHKENDASIVTYVRYGETSVLLMGDVGEKIEREILRQNPDLRADLIKLAHHGDDDAYLPVFLDTLSPTHAAISCGWNNAYGHPSREVLERLAERQIAVGRTDEDGTLIYVSDGEKLWRKRT